MSRRELGPVRAVLGRIAIGYVLVLAIGLGASATAMAAWDRSLNERRSALITETSVEQLRASLSDQESGMRGYVLTGDPSFLAPFEDGQAAEVAAIADIERRSDGDQRVAGPLSLTIRAAQQWREQVALPNIAARSSDEVSSATMIDGKQSFDRVRERLIELNTAVERIGDRAEASAAQQRNTAIAIVFTTVVAAIAVTVAGSLAVGRWLVTPMRSLRDAVSDPAPLVKMPQEGPKELRDLAGAVDLLRVTIFSQRDDAERAHATLEQTATLAAQVSAGLSGEVGDFPDGWSVAAWLQPAVGVVAGDSYDVTLLGPELIGVVLIDIAGHGAGMAVTALRCKELLKAALRSGYAAGEALSWLGQHDHGLEDGNFLTAFVATINTRTGLCRYANAGHPAAVCTTAAEQLSLEPTGPLFGPLDDAEWRTDEVLLSPGAQLVAYTDGLTEARDDARRFYGEQRLASLLADAASIDSQRVLSMIQADLAEHAQGSQADDVTVVVICRDAGHDPQDQT